MGHKIILIVDDNEDDREILRRDLRKAGYEQVITAETAEEGLAKAREHKPALIILDILMPKMFGSDLRRILKEDPLTKDIPVIFLTGLQTEETGAGAGVADTGGNIIFPKSTDPTRLIQKIKEILRGA